MARACGQHNMVEASRDHCAANTCRRAEVTRQCGQRVAAIACGRHLVAEAGGHHNVAEAYRRHYVVNTCKPTDAAKEAKACAQHEAGDTANVSRQPEVAKGGSTADVADVSGNAASSPGGVDIASGDLNKGPESSNARELPSGPSEVQGAAPDTTGLSNETTDIKPPSPVAVEESQPQQLIDEDDWHYHKYDGHIGRVPHKSKVKRLKKIKFIMKVDRCCRVLCRRKKVKPLDIKGVPVEIEREKPQTQLCSCPFTGCSCSGVPKLTSAWLPLGPGVFGLRALFSCCRRTSTRREAVGAFLGRLKQNAEGPGAGPPKQGVAAAPFQGLLPSPPPCQADRMAIFECSKGADYWYRRAMSQLESARARHLGLPASEVANQNEISKPVCFTVAEVEYCSVGSQVEEDFDGELVVLPDDPVLFGRPRANVVCALDGTKVELVKADGDSAPAASPLPPPSWLRKKWTLVKEIASYILKDKFTGIIQDEGDSYESYDVNSGSLFFQIKGTKFASEELNVQGSRIFDPDQFKSSYNSIVEGDPVALTQEGPASPTSSEETSSGTSQQEQSPQTNAVPISNSSAATTPCPKKCLKKESTCTDVEPSPKRVSIDLKPETIGVERPEVPPRPVADTDQKVSEQSVTADDKKPSPEPGQPVGDVDKEHLVGPKESPQPANSESGAAGEKAVSDTRNTKLHVASMHSKSDIISSLSETTSITAERLKQSIWETECTPERSRNPSDIVSSTTDTVNSLLSIKNKDENSQLATVLNTEMSSNSQRLSENTQHAAAQPTHMQVETDEPPASCTETETSSVAPDLGHETTAPCTPGTLYEDDSSGTTIDFEDVSEQIVNSISLDKIVSQKTTRESIVVKTNSINWLCGVLSAKSKTSYHLPKAPIEIKGSGGGNLCETGMYAANDSGTDMSANVGSDVNDKDKDACSISKAGKNEAVDTDTNVAASAEAGDVQSPGGSVTIASHGEHGKSNAEAEAGASANASASANANTAASAGSSSVSQRAGLHVFHAIFLHRQLQMRP